MMKCGDRIYLHTGEWDIKVYDLNENKVINSIELPEKESAKQNFSVIAAIVDNCTLYMQAGPYEFVKSHVYQFKAGRVTELGVLSPFIRIVAADGDYIYVTEKVSSKKVIGEEYEYENWFRGYRYDKQLNKRIEHHFDDHPELIVTDIWEDVDKYWYTGIINPYGNYPERFRGKAFLLSKDKRSGKSVLYKFGENEFSYSYYKGLSITGDAESIWLLGMEDSNGLFTKLLKFSKNKGIIEKEDPVIKLMKNGQTLFPLSIAVDLVKERPGNKTTEYLWFVSRGQGNEVSVFRFDKDAFELTLFTSHREVPPIESMGGYSPYLADESYIWMAIPYYRSGEEVNRRGHLVRISKADASYKVIPVFSKRKEIIKRIAIYSLIIVSILSAVLSIILGFSNISKLKYLKGWKLTAAIIVSAILLAILVPIFENIYDKFESFGLFFVTIILGLASILLSRSLTYLIKLTEFKKISWVLSIFLSFFSGNLFFVLFLSTYRSVEGEAAWGGAIIALGGACFVSFISLIVNIRERIS